MTTFFPIATLPIELCVHISTFLSYDDWQNLLNSGKIFEAIKIATRTIVLNFSTSLQYCTDVAFQSLVNSKLRDTQRQLCLSLHSCSDSAILSSARFVHRLILSYCTLQSLQGIVTDVEELTLLFCCELEELDSSSNCLRKIDLYMCPSFRNFSQLSQLTSLRICESEALINVAPLKYIQYLSLLYCSNLRDLSGLIGGRNHSIVLVACHSIQDITPLQHFHHVEINGCPQITSSSFESLKDVEYVSIEYCAQANGESLESIFKEGRNKTFHFLA